MTASDVDSPNSDGSGEAVRADGSTPSTPATKAERPKSGRARDGWSLVVVILAGILTVVSVVGIWAGRLVKNEDAYLRAVSPLATDSDVVAAIEDRTVVAVMNGIDGLNVSDRISAWLEQQNVPKFVADAVSIGVSSLNDNVEGLVRRTVNDVVESPAFEKTWVQLNTVAHRQLDALLSGDSVLLDPSGNIALQLQPVIVKVRDALVAKGMNWASKIPDSTAELVLVPAADVEQVQGLYRTVTTIIWVLVGLTLALFVLAVVLARDRWRAVRRCGYALVISCVLLAIGLTIGRNVLVSNATAATHPQAIATVIDTVTAGVRIWVRLLVLIGLVLVVVSLIVGRDRAAQRVRGWLRAARAVLQRPSVVLWRRLGGAAVAIVVAAVLLFADGLSSAVTAVLALLGVFAVVLVLLPGEPTKSAAAPAPSARIGSASG